MACKEPFDGTSGNGYQPDVEKPLSPPEDKFFHIQCVNLFSGQMKEVKICKLPGKPSLKEKIRRCLDILFDRTYIR